MLVVVASVGVGGGGERRWWRAAAAQQQLGVVWATAVCRVPCAWLRERPPWRWEWLVLPRTRVLRPAEQGRKGRKAAVRRHRRDAILAPLAPPTRRVSRLPPCPAPPRPTLPPQDVLKQVASPMATASSHLDPYPHYIMSGACERCVR